MHTAADDSREVLQSRLIERLPLCSRRSLCGIEIVGVFSGLISVFRLFLNDLSRLSQRNLSSQGMGISLGGAFGCVAVLSCPWEQLYSLLQVCDER